MKRLRLVGATIYPEDNPTDWTDTFQTISMQQLYSLSCQNLNCNMKSIVTLLSTCRNTIQEVELYLQPQLLDVLIFQALKPLPYLRTLILKHVSFADESSVVTLLERLPSLENLIVKDQATFVLPKQAAPFLKNLKRHTLVDIYPFAGSDTPIISPGLLRSLAQDGSKLERVTLIGDADSEILFVVLNTLAALPSLKFLCVNGIQRYRNRKLNKENGDENLSKFFNQFLLGCDNVNSGVTTATSRTKIEELVLSHVHELTYTMINKLGELANLQNLDISLSSINVWSDTAKLAMVSDNGFLNINICGVLELLRKGKKLRKVVFRGVISFADEAPSDYLKEKLVLQQRNSFQLRKYIVEPGYPRRLNDKSFESDLEIINIHYK